MNAKPEILVRDGRTQPIFDYKECLFEQVFVETPVDTDGDGKRDLVAVYVRRPAETLQGMKVPAIYVANPYMLECNEDWYVGHDVNREVQAYGEQALKKAHVASEPRLIAEIGGAIHSACSLPERETKGFAETAVTEEIKLDCITDWYSYFNSRGYASVFAGGLGTRGSEGFNSCGSEEETAAVIAVIDWLCGRRKAFTNRTDQIEIKADWCTGSVAMSGKSYLGTLAIAAACTGVPGLKTIVPEAAISSWYDYYRYNGLNLPAVGWQGDDLDLLAKYCFSRRFDKEDYEGVADRYAAHIAKLLADEDRDSGNYNRFWDERNYMNHADRIKASVFIIHGLNDWNVKPNQCDLFWRKLEEYNIPRKMMLHQGDHIYIHNLGSIDFNDILHRWMDHWLYGIDNGVMEEVPTVLVQNNLDQNRWDAFKTWPMEGAVMEEYRVSLSGSACNENRLEAGLSKLGRTADAGGTASFTDDLSLTAYDWERDNQREWLDSLVLTPEEERPYRLAYVSDPLCEDLRISGSIRISLDASLDRNTGILSAMLVDYGSDCRLVLEQEVLEKEGIHWGKNTPDADVMGFLREAEPSSYRVISRGWTNAENRSCNYSKEAVLPGKRYSFSFDMIPMDYTVRAGHRLELILYGIDAEATQRPKTVTRFEVDQESICLQIPQEAR